ncbi:MAG TPA: alpha-amylase family glycosyl hydrolase [Nocardioides sp.]|nr:alpha-amylase family glycosyl hydrolase [Nocardioides sp.]
MTDETLRSAVAPLLEQLYPGRGEEVASRVVELAEARAGRLGPVRARPSQATAVLITYGDAIRRADETPLHTLAGVLHDQVSDLVSDVHLLPMFPWTSDDGFAVVDHRQVNPALGTWEDIADLAADHALMFDFVANHVSAASPWFTGWLAGEPAYDAYFIERDPAFDTSHVVRPRVLPLHHQYSRPDGSSVEAWTTFGADQVDVNVANPQALLELTDVLLGYLERGASAIRLDAIGFLWKESGTTCLHLPQTHAIVKLWRALVDHVAPGTQLLTETNVPHAENISYFGDGTDEAHLVYQFALPPLVLHSFVSSDTTVLAQWARGIGPVSGTATWFNFLASHDGIGLRPTEGILSDAERQALVERALAHGGRVSMAAPAGGRETVYELNINFLEALASPEEVGDDAILSAKALAAHSILLAFLGIPAVYYHSLFGSGPDHEGMRATGINRRINRAVLDADRLVDELHHHPRRKAVFGGLAAMLETRRGQPAFSPYGTQQVEESDPRVLVLRRGAGTPDELVCATNVTEQAVVLDEIAGTDVITGREHHPLRLPPFGYAWIRPSGRGGDAPVG